MNQRQGQTDDQACNIAKLGFGCYTEDSHDEDEGQDDLNQKRLACAAVKETVGSEAGVRAEEDQQDCCAECCADELGDNIADKVLTCHFLADEHCN